MNFRAVQAAAAIAMLGVPRAATAQVQAQVTLNVPVNLTQLSPDISKIRVACNIRSEAITTGNANREVGLLQEAPTSGGQIVATVPVVFNFTGLDNPVGKTAYVTCTLQGWSTADQQWAQFTGGQTSPAFKTNVTVGFSETTFTW